MRYSGSRDCLLCHEHVLSGDALVAVKSVLDGGPLITPQEIIGVMHADYEFCASVLIARLWKLVAK